MLDHLNRRWFAGYLITMAVCSVTIFYLPLHLGLGIPLGKLAEPFLVFSLVSLPVGRGIYWAQPQLKFRRTGPLYLVMSFYLAAFFCLTVFYSTRFGFLPAQGLLRDCAIAAALGFSLPWIGYILHWRILGW